MINTFSLFLQVVATLNEMSLNLTVLQFNTLGKHLAETIQFPYGIDIKAEQGVDRGSRYVSWEEYGINEKSWLWPQLKSVESPQEYLLNHDHGGTYEVEESNGKLIYSWSQRFSQLVQQIQRHDPDLIFLEEVERGTVHEFATMLSVDLVVLDQEKSTESKQTSPSLNKQQELKYSGVYAGRGPSATHDGVLILWKNSHLSARGHGEVFRYSDRANKLAVLQTLTYGEDFAFIACGTHLHWNPGAPFQAAEAEELVAKLGEAQLPVFLGGDFNCGPGSTCQRHFPSAGFVDLDNLLSDRKQIPRFTTHVPHAPVIKLTDARRWDDKVITQLHPVKVDYVYIRGLNIDTVQNLDTNIVGFTPSAANGLPRKNISASDHFPIAYNVIFTPCIN